MLLAVLAIAASAPPWNTVLFHADTGNGYKAVRVPNIVTFNNGTLLAVVQAKLQGTGDDGATLILKRRSDDDGATWTQPEVVLSDEKIPSEFDAVAVIDPSTDTAFLVSSYVFLPRSMHPNRPPSPLRQSDVPKDGREKALRQLHKLCYKEHRLWRNMVNCYSHARKCYNRQCCFFRYRVARQEVQGTPARAPPPRLPRLQRHSQQFCFDQRR
jgi:hypothetical protein